TAHTTNLVPVVLAAGGSLADGGGVPDGEAPRSGGMRDGRLADLAPTLLDLMGLERPAEMTGRSLLRG
ncbi:MAG: hypothetical protein ACRYGC_03535, partial [Janthinobacterium lividum]